MSTGESDESEDDQPKEEDEPLVPEPERDAALEEAYKLEKEDAGSDEDVSDDDDEDDENATGLDGVELTKDQRRELEVSLCFRTLRF